MTQLLDSREELAAAFALGVLTRRQRLWVRLRRRFDFELACRIDDWSARLKPLADSLPVVEPRLKVWHEIEADLAGRSKTHNGRHWIDILLGAIGR